jgi:hypothetical protein
VKNIIKNKHKNIFFIMAKLEPVHKQVLIALQAIPGGVNYTWLYKTGFGLIFSEKSLNPSTLSLREVCMKIAEEINFNILFKYNVYYNNCYYVECSV